GIIKENGAVIAYPNEEKILSIIRRCAEEKNAKLKIADVRKAEGCELSLKGAYQPYNAAVVLEIVNVMREKGIEIPEKAVTDGLKNTQWPARFEWVRDNIVIDGAHNLDGIKALKQSLLELNKPVTLVMAMMEDKAYEECIREIAPAASRFIATEIDMPRCLKAADLAEIAGNAEVIPDVKKAIKAAQNGVSGVICICGSLYLAGEARKFLKKS
ncbi:MAG: hypothetical protein IJP94_03745, partial [Clostridia bacterium]|nr:hypothetical protein [Clostridia bacterium]